MKAVVQRVNDAQVSKKNTGEIVGKISQGLFVLLGIEKSDTEEKAAILADKIANLRIMSDSKDKMNLSLLDTTKEILVVSQFTLISNTKKGNRPSFVKAADPKKAEQIYDYFVYRLKNQGLKVETGSFGNYMSINAKLDGPVTIVY